MSATAPVTVLIPGDLHLTEAGLPNHQAALWAVAEANEVVRPDFVQFIGDNVQDGTDEQFALFRDVTRRLRVPWHALVGDHDAQGDAEAARFRAEVGEPWGSTSLGGFRFVWLNTQEGRPVGLSPRQAGRFLAEADGAIAAGERVVVFQHNYPYQIWEDYAGPGVDDWRAVVQTRRVAGIFTGHTHYWQVANDGRNAVVTTRSIGDPEGGPPGYTLVHLQGEDLAVTYRSVEDHGPLVLVTHPRAALLATGPAHVVKGPDVIAVRVRPARPAAVTARVDGGPTLTLEPVGEGRWVAPLAGDRLAKGRHRLSVRAEGLAGVGGQEIEFAVDPTGRYNPVPAAAPEVTATAFC